MIRTSTLLSVVVGVFLVAFTVMKCCPCCQCPTSDSYPATCTRSAIPPWPICLMGGHDVEYYVSKAKEGASRCCSDDLTDCKCPKKDTDKFKDNIGAWCADIATCDNNDNDDESHAAPKLPHVLTVAEVEEALVE